MHRKIVVRNLPSHFSKPDGSLNGGGVNAALLEASANAVVDELEATGLRVVAADIRPVDAQFAYKGFVAIFTCEGG